RTAGAEGLAPLYLANLVCSMGMMGFVVVAGPLADSLGLQAWQIGLSATAGGLGWVLASQAWGRAADRIGRKKVLVAGLAGFAAGYLALCLAAQAGAAWGLAPLAAWGALIATRFSMGLAYAALPAAGAAVIADRFAPDARAGQMGRLAAAQSAGLLLGPAFVGAISSAISGASPVAPLFWLALAPAPALLFLLLRLPADGPETAERPAPLSLADPRLLRPVLAALATLSAVGVAQIVVGFAALDRLALPAPQATRTAALALFCVGVALVVAQLAIARLGWSPRRLMGVGGGVAALGFVFAALAGSPATLVAAYAVAGFGAGWVFPSISAAAANAVSNDEQGRAAGSVSTAMGLGAMLGPSLGGALYALAEPLPFLVAALAMAAVAAAGAGMARKDEARPAT
ncbi:MAG: MFS transporter, partial [Pseudomonadota bacterium]